MKNPIIIFLASFLVCFVTGMAQENDSIKPPDEKIKVNKEFDKDGNLIRYDSIYSYSSGNWNLDDKKMDSIMKRFFQDRESMPYHDPFEMPDFMFPHTFPYDFGSMDSIFRQRFEDHRKHFDSMQQEYRPRIKGSPPNKI